MKCSKCSKYSYQLRRCAEGKINPSTIKGGTEAALIMGISYICGIDAENSAKKEKIRSAILKKLGKE